MAFLPINVLHLFWILNVRALSQTLLRINIIYAGNKKENFSCPVEYI